MTSSAASGSDKLTVRKIAATFIVLCGWKFPLYTGGHTWTTIVTAGALPFEMEQTSAAEKLTQKETETPNNNVL